MRIILDFDSTLANTPKAMHSYYQILTNDYSTTYSEDKVRWNMEGLCPLFDREKVDDMFIQEDFFNHLELYDNVLEVLTVLKEQGHELVVASCHRIEGMEYKKKWIQENLPMIDEIILIPIGGGMEKLDKSGVEGDIIIDDSLSALESSKCKYKFCYGIYEWNNSWKGNRVYNWIDVAFNITHIQTLKELGLA